MSNYATNSVLTGIDTSDLAKKIDLSNLNSDMDKVDIGRLQTAPVDLRISNGVKKCYENCV